MRDTEHALAVAGAQFPGLVPQLTGPWPGATPWHCNFLDRVLHSEILSTPATGPTIEDAIHNAENAVRSLAVDAASRRERDKAQAGDTL